MIYLESKGNRYRNSYVSFNKDGSQIEFDAPSARDLFKKVIDYLFDNGYSFKGEFHNNPTRKLLTKEEVEDKIKTSTYQKKDFHNISNSKYWIMSATPVKQMFRELTNMLNLFGAKDIKYIGLDNDSEVDKPKYTHLKNWGYTDTDEKVEDKPIEISKIDNPFKQSICVLGESGSGKSVTIENILEHDEHNFEFIIPTAATTGLLAQFSPSKSGYVLSRLGNMLINASKNPKELYTAVFDEMHKSNVIEMINDELLQAISTKRNKGKRFISLDEDTSEIYKNSDLITERGNLLIPDNFGFIFISSKPKVIANNSDFFNRVEIVILTDNDRDIKTSDELISKIIPNEEKVKLSSSRND
jgi:hypothetical protein